MHSWHNQESRGTVTATTHPLALLAAWQLLCLAPHYQQPFLIIVVSHLLVPLLLSLPPSSHCLLAAFSMHNINNWSFWGWYSAIIIVHCWWWSNKSSSSRIMLLVFLYSWHPLHLICMCIMHQQCYGKSKNCSFSRTIWTVCKSRTPDFWASLFWTQNNFHRSGPRTTFPGYVEWKLK